MWIAENWTDFELIDAGKGKKLERWGKQHLLRPDPQAIWPLAKAHEAWAKIDGVYHRSDKGGGEWQFNRKIPDYWQINYGELRFKIGTLGFKHTGLFPEQAANWDWMTKLIEDTDEEIEVLNLFAYTGGATLACAKAGAAVTHVDASKGMVNWAKDNMKLSGMEAAPVRFLIDDCLKFVQRESRRGRKYKGIIMDPPSYGRGPGGEMWKIEESLYPLIQACMTILDENPLFFLINSYTTGLSPSVLGNVLKLSVGAKYGGQIEAEEVGLPITSSGLVLPCGASGRWQR